MCSFQNLGVTRGQSFSMALDIIFWVEKNLLHFKTVYIKDIEKTKRKSCSPPPSPPLDPAKDPRLYLKKTPNLLKHRLLHPDWEDLQMTAWALEEKFSSAWILH